MSSPLGSYIAYTQFIYDLLTDRPTIETHTLTVYTIGQTVGILRGEIKFHAGHTLRVFEQIDFLEQRILKYSYEVYYHDQQVWWYDPMPHPHIPELQSTHITSTYRLILNTIESQRQESLLRNQTYPI